MTAEQAIKLTNRGMIAFDAVLGTATLVAPRQTLWVLGHERASADAEALFRRCGPIWLTFAAAHAVADRRGRRRDWGGPARPGAAESPTDTAWAPAPPGVTRPGGRAAGVAAGGGENAQ